MFVGDGLAHPATYKILQFIPIESITGQASLSPTKTVNPRLNRIGGVKSNSGIMHSPQLIIAINCHPIMPIRLTIYAYAFTLLS